MNWTCQCSKCQRSRSALKNIAFTLTAAALAARQNGETFLPLGWDMDRKEWERVRALWTEGGAT